MIDYTLLGTGGGMPMTFRALSSVLLNYKGHKILLDCGEGTQVQMRKYHTGFRDIDAVFLSHMHGDHIFGLPGLLSTMGNSDRTEKVFLFGPKGLKKVVDGLLYSLEHLPFPIEIVEDFKETGILPVKDRIELTEDAELRVHSFPLRHRIECLGYRFDLHRRPKFDVERAKLLPIPVHFWKSLQNGKEVTHEGRTYLPSDVLGEERRGLSLSFVPDTKYFPEISDFVRGSDLVICEGTYGDDADRDKAKKNRHMTFREAATIAAGGEVKQLVITHFSPSMERPVEFRGNATSIFEHTFVAYDGYSGTVGFEEE